uniref:Flavin-containing monooxygenase n=1 Tax=Trichuris muris TaxID=70415 RepID=A0A5S6QTK9_TRIMR
MRICVIGAGAAGICACKHLKSIASWTVVVYECLERVGGTWNYTEDLNAPSGVTLPVMYKSLVTNLPKEIMAFPDFPFSDNISESFVSHEVVAQYLQRYADYHNLLPLIKFNHSVVKLENVACEDDQLWKVIAKNLITGQIETELFHSVFVCNGHLSIPKIPPISGYDLFDGLIMHARDYREPGMFKGMTVACLGAGPSGTDISLELSEVASKVYLCHNDDRLAVSLSKNIEETIGIERLERKAAVLYNGRKISIDAIVLCTGYVYDFPFIKDDLGLKVDDNSVSPLYLHMISIHFPSLFFIGLCRTVLPFPFFDVQVRFAVELLKGNISLPSVEWMLNDEREQKALRLSLPKGQRQGPMFMGPLQWPYLGRLTTMARLEPLPPYMEHVYTRLSEIRPRHLATYKTFTVRLLNDTDFELRHPDRNEAIVFSLSEPPTQHPTDRLRCRGVRTIELNFKQIKHDSLVSAGYLEGVIWRRIEINVFFSMSFANAQRSAEQKSGN